MSEVVHLRKMYFGMIVRIVLKRRIFYRTAVLEGEERPAGFCIEDIEEFLHVKQEDDWFKEYIENLTDARRHLESQLRELGEKIDGGFFVTVRPGCFDCISVGKL